MPDSTGFGSYTESGAVVPCISPDGREVNFTAQMFLDDEPPISGGREIWGFPKKFANPEFGVCRDTVWGKLFYQDLPVATGTMSYKTKAVSNKVAVSALTKPQVNLKVIPCISNCVARLAQLVEYQMSEIELLEAWEGPARVQFMEHANARASSLPNRKTLPGKHFRANITLPHGKVLHDYIADQSDTEDESRLGRSQILRTAMPAMSPSYPMASDGMDQERAHAPLYQSPATEYFMIFYGTDLDHVLDFVPDRLMPMVDDAGKAIISLRWQRGAGTGLGEYNLMRVLALCQDRVSRDICNFGLMGFADNSSVITMNREVFGRPLKFAQPGLETRKDTVVGSLGYSGIPVCAATMAYKQRSVSIEEASMMMQHIPEYNVKLIPNCDGGQPAIAELVRHSYTRFSASEAWSGHSNVAVSAHCNAPVADFIPSKVLDSFHITAFSQVGMGDIVEDYL